MAGEPIGIFGGTFDPVHLGHLTVAQEVKECLGIDDFRLVPAARPPHRDFTHASPRHRLAMLDLALEGHPGLRADTREFTRDGPSWMVDTLRSLRSGHPDAALVLVVGQDAANSLDSWHEWRDILRLANLAVMSRAGEREECSAELDAELAPRRVSSPQELTRSPAGRVARVPVSRVDASSTEVRRRVRADEPIDELVAPAVAAYIRHHGLYRDGPRGCD